MRIEKWVGLAFAAVVTITLSGCGDTWSGLKKDTGENLEKAGEAIEEVGEKIRN